MRLLFSLLLFILHSSLFTCLAQDKYLDTVSEALKAVETDSIRKAENLFYQALRISPDDSRNALIYSNLGKLMESQGRYEEAVSAYNKAILQYPGTPAFLHLRANLYLNTGQYMLAIADYKHLTEQDPKNAEYNSAIGYAYTKLAQYADADRFLDKALEVNPREYVALVGKTIIMMQTSHEDEAAQQLNILIEMFPDKAELYSLRSDQESENKQPELALQDINKAIELESNNKNYILRRAYIYYNTHRYQLALADFQRAIDLGVPRSAIDKDMQKCKGN